MASKIKNRQKFLHYYEEKTGKKEIDMHDVARLAKEMGWALPALPDPLDLLAKQFTDAAREEMRVDKKTNRPYRGRLAIIQQLPSGKQLGLWINTDDAPRHKIVKALTLYREQMVGEAVIGTNTAEHWNGINPAQRPIEFATDFTDDVQWRRNAPEEGEEAS